MRVWFLAILATYYSGGAVVYWGWVGVWETNEVDAEEDEKWVWVLFLAHRCCHIMYYLCIYLCISLSIYLSACLSVSPPTPRTHIHIILIPLCHSRIIMFLYRFWVNRCSPIILLGSSQVLSERNTACNLAILIYKFCPTKQSSLNVVNSHSA